MAKSTARGHLEYIVDYPGQSQVELRIRGLRQQTMEPSEPSSRRDRAVPAEVHFHNEGNIASMPFESSQQLCDKLSYDELQNVLVRSESTRKIQKDWLPGDPRIRLGDPHFADSIYKEYATPRLNGFSPFLWLVGRPDSAHVASLTHQIVRGRRIILTDDPELHLVWIRDRVFIKPLPDYMLSYAFWDYFLRGDMSTAMGMSQQKRLYHSLSGFVRTYSHLVRRRSDYDLARHPDHRLIGKNIHFSDLIQLLEAMERRVQDQDVSPRWRYGELRLSRLNFWTRVLLKHHNFAKVYGQYSDYVAHFYAPILFLFGVLSVILNAMQVGLSLHQPNAGGEYLELLSRVSRVFVPLSLFVVAVAIAWFLVAVVTTILRIVLLGIKTQVQRRVRRPSQFRS